MAKTFLMDSELFALNALKPLDDSNSASLQSVPCNPVLQHK